MQTQSETSPPKPEALPFFAYSGLQFRFDVDEELAKSEDPRAKGGPTARIVGIVSASGKDFQGETLDQRGLDWDYFVKHGWFNHEHQQGPEHVLGFPESVSAAKDDEGNDATRVVGHLLMDLPLAKSIHALAMALQKSGSKRQIGFSVEGQVVERDPLDPKKVLKARVRNVAITAHPVRSTARFEMVKSLSDLSDIVKSEGAQDAGYQTPPSGGGDVSALLPQSIDGGKKPRKKIKFADVLSMVKGKFPQLPEGFAHKTANWIYQRALAKQDNA